MNENEQLQLADRPALKPIRNLRSVRPRVCATCKYLVPREDGFGECLRLLPNDDVFDGEVFEVGLQDLDAWFVTCDYWFE